MTNELGVKWVQGGGVPGGHYVIHKPGKKPYIPCMDVCYSIPLKYTDTVVDLGAYCGTYSIYAARFPVKQVIGYEPTPFTFSVLQKTQLPNLKWINAAVIPSNHKKVRLNVGGLGDSNSIIRKKRNNEYIIVPAINFEKAVTPATVIKMDVEGAEYTYPLVELLPKLNNLRAIIIDFHIVSGSNWEEAAYDISKGIEAAGFKSVKRPYWDELSGIDITNMHWSRISNNNAGSWIRDINPEPTETFEPMLSGKICCGCGISVNGNGKTLCRTCWNKWKPEHRRGFTLEKYP